MSSQANRPQIYNSRELRNFIYSYTLPESIEVLNQIIDHFTDGLGTSIQSESENERILDFLESLEELLPALYKETDEKSEFDRMRLN